MLDLEPDNILDTIEGSKNPEIHHYNHGVHPGLRWSIKTILPGPDLVSTETSILFNFWNGIQRKHPYLVRITKLAFDWNGVRLDGWWTIWVQDRIDIIWNQTEDGFSYHIVDREVGLKASSRSLVQILDSRHTAGDQSSYNVLLGIAEFIKTYTGDHQSKINRSKIRVLDNGDLFDETNDR